MGALFSRSPDPLPELTRFSFLRCLALRTLIVVSGVWFFGIGLTLWKGWARSRAENARGTAAAALSTLFATQRAETFSLGREYQVCVDTTVRQAAARRYSNDISYR